MGSTTSVEFINVYPVVAHLWRTVISLEMTVMEISLLWEWPWCHDDVIKGKHFPRYWTFGCGIHRWPVNSPLIGQWRWALMFSLICAWINGWVNNGEAGDLRRHRTHYDVTLMRIENHEQWWCQLSRNWLHCKLSSPGNDNMRCRQWRRSWQHDNSRFWVMRESVKFVTSFIVGSHIIYVIWELVNWNNERTTCPQLFVSICKIILLCLREKKEDSKWTCMVVQFSRRGNIRITN